MRELTAIFAVVVSHQVRGTLAKRCRFTQLLSRLGIGWRIGDADVDDSSGAEFHDDECLELAKAEIDNGQEVTRPNLRGVIVQEGRPGLGPWRVSDEPDACISGWFVCWHAAPTYGVHPSRLLIRVAVVVQYFRSGVDSLCGAKIHRLSRLE